MLQAFADAIGLGGGKGDGDNEEVDVADSIDGGGGDAETKSSEWSSHRHQSTTATTVDDDHFLYELWRIFTFYALHTDATQPEVMRVTTFVRFARDTQMLSSRLTATMVELEIVRLSREKKIEQYGGKDSTVEGQHTIALNFGDFLALLEIMAAKVYPMPENAGEEGKRTQIRRLLLENVLFLASRREKMFLPRRYPPPVKKSTIEIKPSPTPEDVIAVYKSSLNGIFKFYVEKANKRRSNELSAEAAKKGLVGSNRRMRGNAAEKQHAQAARELQQTIRADVMGYPEYMQFCTDFSLRSTSLLTAIQVGELYLHAVPLDPEALKIRQMNEAMFHSLLINMALLAYRDCHPTVLPHNKVKALLNFMWRAVNCSTKVDRLAVSGRKDSAASAHAGHLNMYGAGAFSDFFLAQWIGEPTNESLAAADPDAHFELLAAGHLYTHSMPDYTAPVEEPRPDGKHCLRKIVKSPEMLAAVRTRAKSHSQDGLDVSVGAANGGAATNPPSDSRPSILHDFQLAALFRLRPEIGELVHLEIRQHFANIRDTKQGGNTRPPLPPSPPPRK
jgi:hypothetical protein